MPSGHRTPRQGEDSGERTAFGGSVRVLLVEDSPTDAELELRELKRAGFSVAARVVETEEAFRAGAAEFVPDVILSDFSMPQFDGMAALAIAREHFAHIPFIFVSGTLGEEYAIRALQSGAADYVLKTNLVRLPAAVQRALDLQRERAAARDRVLAAESKYHDLIEHASDGISLVDAGGNYLLVNSRFCEMLGYSRDALLGMNVLQTYPAEDRDAAAASMSALARAGSRLVERPLLRRDGTRLTVEVSVRLRGDGTRQAIVRDVTERKQAEERIARLTRIYAVLSGINSTIVRVTDRDELFREACRIAVEAGFVLAWIALCDRQTGELAAVAWGGEGEDYLPLVRERLKHPESLPGRAVRDGEPAIINDVAQAGLASIKHEAVKRGFRGMAVLPLIVSGQAVGVLTLYARESGFFNEEEMKLLNELAGNIAFALSHIEREERLAYLASHDPLTGLPNRAMFLERLAQNIQDARRSRVNLCVLILNLDRFKAINDSLGRHAGDELLRQVAKRWVSTSHDPSRFARLGADQFASAVHGFSTVERLVQRTEEKLRDCFGAAYALAGSELMVSGRIGIALYPQDGEDADTLFRNAEAALAKAKASGERYLFYGSEMSERIAEQVKLESELRQALARREFVLHYQPKVDTESGRIMGVEALIRWNHPSLGLVPPGEFITLMEATGLILEAGAWALAQAVADRRRWIERGLDAPRIAVNVSAIQLRRRDFVDTFASILGGEASHGIDLEITESLIMDDVRTNVEKLGAVRELGANIAIDDFGTGYSSLGYLARLPVNALKIDRSFIVGMTEDAGMMALVSTIISLAHSLRLEVVAEGVESEDQAKFLRLLKCDQIQGYLVSKPLPFDEMAAFIGKAARRP